MRKKISIALLALCLTALGLYTYHPDVEAASGDVAVLVRGTQASARRDLLRMNSTFDLVPGVTAITDLGSSSLQFANAWFGSTLTTVGVVYVPTAITVNTTLTVADGTEHLVGTVAGNISITLPSAVTAGNGFIEDIQDKGGVLDATHALAINATSGNINGSASKAYSTAYGGLRFVSDGTNWFCR